MPESGSCFLAHALKQMAQADPRHAAFRLLTRAPLVFLDSKVRQVMKRDLLAEWP